MLVEFRVANFRSLREEQTLSMVASADKTNLNTHCIETGFPQVPRLTRAAVIYGANASGKSNLIFALATMRNMVLQSTEWAESTFADQHTPFRLDECSAKEPTTFEISLLLFGTRYQYGYSYDAQRVTSEWLLVNRKGKAQRWFERRWDPDRSEYAWEPFSAYFTGPRETWRKATRPQALFLTTASKLNSELLIPMMNWFAGDLMILNAPGALALGHTLARIGEQDFKDRLLAVLRAADPHLADVHLTQRRGEQYSFKLEPGKPPEVFQREEDIPEIEFGHMVEGGETRWFDRRYESLGTQRLLAFAGPILDALAGSKLLVVDELDSSLHPLLTRYVLSLFHDTTAHTGGAQLVFTTHDTTLLDGGLLRRDEIWFVEKDGEQASRVFPLSDFSPRKNEALEAGYLRGRYGAVPFVTGSNLN